MYYEYEYENLVSDIDDLYSDREYEYTETIEWQDYYHNLAAEIEIIE